MFKFGNVLLFKNALSFLILAGKISHYKESTLKQHLTNREHFAYYNRFCMVFFRENIYYTRLSILWN